MEAYEDGWYECQIRYRLPYVTNRQHMVSGVPKPLPDAPLPVHAMLSVGHHTEFPVFFATADDWAGIPILAQTPFRQGASTSGNYDANGATGGGPWRLAVGPST